MPSGLTVYECPESVITLETVKCPGMPQIPGRLAARYSTDVSRQWVGPGAKRGPCALAGDPQTFVNAIEESRTEAVADGYRPKVCLLVNGSFLEAQQGTGHGFFLCPTART